jgi:hypothetical protein
MQDALEYRPFLVGSKPFCVWEWNLRQRNREFLDSFDPDYFYYTAAVHWDRLQGDHSQLAALGLRLAYSHAMEAFFALLFAALQAPGCVFAWLDKYTTADLRELVEAVNRQEPIRTVIELEKTSWDTISAAIHRELAIPDDKETEQRIKDEYAQFWAWLASDFGNELLHREYNCIKHGMRVALGGFQIAVGIQSAPGVRASAESMHHLGGSIFGAGFFLGEAIGGDKFNVRMKRYARNWLPQTLRASIDLMAMSMSNVVSFLKQLNGAAAETVQFVWPPDLDRFQDAYRVPLVNDLCMDRVLDASHIQPFTREAILKAYERRSRGSEQSPAGKCP